MIIDCDDCAMQHSTACEDCLVTFLQREGGPLELADDEQEAMANLADGGLVAPLRLVPRHSRPDTATG